MSNFEFTSDVRLCFWHSSIFTFKKNILPMSLVVFVTERLCAESIYKLPVEFMLTFHTMCILCTQEQVRLNTSLARIEVAKWTCDFKMMYLIKIFKAYATHSHLYNTIFKLTSNEMISHVHSILST